MVEKIILTQGEILLARLDPAKHAEIGKIRPVVILTAQFILDAGLPIVFICPLSSHSQPAASGLHVTLAPRDNLKVTSYALVEHCRSITIKRLVQPRLGQLTPHEINAILDRLQRMLGR
jgi:mRNA interferase MazF